MLQKHFIFICLFTILLSSNIICAQNKVNAKTTVKTPSVSLNKAEKEKPYTHWSLRTGGNLSVIYLTRNIKEEIMNQDIAEALFMKKRFYILIILFLFYLSAFPTHTQAPLIDNLIKETDKNSIHDFIKIKSLVNITWEFKNNSLNKSIIFANKELSITAKLKGEGDIVQAESVISSIYNRKSAFNTTLIQYKKVLILREKLKEYFESWEDTLEQIDDVCVIDIKI